MTSYRTMKKVEDVWYGQNAAGEWVQLTKPDAAQEAPTAIEPYQAAPMPSEIQQINVVTPPIRHDVRFKTSYVDRAKAFNLRVRWISILASVSICIAAVKFVDVPLLSWSLLLWFWGTYAGVWLIAYLLDTFISPDGIAFLHMLFGWQYLRREQRERHNHYRERGQ